MSKRVVIYLRQSHEHEGSVSLAVQEADCRAMCERNGWAVAAVIVDNNVSGAVAPAEREGMAHVLDMLPQIDVVAPARLDRLSRVLEHCLSFRRVCNAADVEIVTADGQITETNASMMFPLLGMVAEWERERTAERTAKGRRRVFAEGRAMSTPPYGYRIVRRDGGAYLDIDPVPAEDIREMAAHVIAGMACADIVYLLNQHGVPTPRDYAAIRAGRTPKGSKWTGSTLRKMLASPALRGIRVRHENGRAVACLNPDGSDQVVAPEILDLGTWHRIRSVLDDRGTPRMQPVKTDSLLTGVARCGVCGGPMAHDTHVYRGQRTRHYKCQDKSCVAIRAEATELEVEARFFASVGGVRLHRKVVDRGRDVAAELADTERGIEGLTSLAMSDPGNAAMLGPKLTELRQKRDVLTAERDAPPRVRYETDSETLAELWRRGTTAERRGLLDETGLAITIGARREGTSKKLWDSSRVRVEVADEWMSDAAEEIRADAE